jgi:hypothetical protein
MGNFEIEDQEISGTAAPGISVTICSLAYPKSRRTGCSDSDNYLSIDVHNEESSKTYKIIGYYLDSTATALKSHFFLLNVEILEKLTVPTLIHAAGGCLTGTAGSTKIIEGSVTNDACNKECYKEKSWCIYFLHNDKD